MKVKSKCSDLHTRRWRLIATSGGDEKGGMAIRAIWRFFTGIYTYPGDFKNQYHSRPLSVSQTCQRKNYTEHHRSQSSVQITFSLKDRMIHIYSNSI